MSVFSIIVIIVLFHVYCPVHVQVLYMSHVVKMWKDVVINEIKQVQSHIYFNLRAK